MEKGVAYCIEGVFRDGGTARGKAKRVLAALLQPSSDETNQETAVN